MWPWTKSGVIHKRQGPAPEAPASEASNAAKPPGAVGAMRAPEAQTARRAAPSVARQRRHQPPWRQAEQAMTDPSPGRCFVFEPGDVFRRPASGARPLRRWGRWWKGRAKQAR
jgi:hypothetical protein